jgi:hypothetical protein
MNISIQTLPSDPNPPGAIPAGSPGSGTAGPAFDQFLPRVATPAKADDPAAQAANPAARQAAPGSNKKAASDADAATEQAATTAALLWAPVPPPPETTSSLTVTLPSMGAPAQNSVTTAPRPDGATAPVGKTTGIAAGPAPIANGDPSSVSTIMKAASVTPSAFPDGPILSQSAAMPAASSVVPRDPVAPAPVADAANTEAAVAAMNPTAVAPVAPAGGRPFALGTTGKEKIARAALLLGRNPDPAAPDTENSSVSSTQQTGKGPKPIVGIGVAQRASDMPSAPDVHRFMAEDSASPRVLPMLNAGNGPTGAAPVTHFALTSSDPVVQAHDTVAAVLQAVDTREQSAAAGPRVVNLQFAFGQETLAVRVELRDGAVHANFQTESPELRGALAQEWRHVAAAPENVLRLAEPVFAAARPGGATASFNADSGASRQQPQAQQPATEFSLRPASSGIRQPSAVATSEAPRLSSLPTVLHLQAFA